MKEDKKKMGHKEKKPDIELLDMEDIGKKKKRKTTIFDYIRYIIMAAAVVVLGVSGYQIYSIMSEYAKGENAYEEVTDNFTTEEVPDEPVEASGVVVNANGFVKASVNFEGLQQENPDIKAWIQFEGIPEINYPVLQHPSDNEFYLRRMYNKAENTAGSIYIDVSNSADFQHSNTFVYGHNMKNLSMFGRLKEYKEQAFYAGKEYFWIYTPTVNYQYQIFSIHESKVGDNMFMTYEAPCDDFTQFAADAKAKSIYDTGVEITGNDKIITLCTCTARGNDYRLLVHGKLIGTEWRTPAEAAPENAAEDSATE